MAVRRSSRAGSRRAACRWGASFLEAGLPGAGCLRAPGLPPTRPTERAPCLGDLSPPGRQWAGAQGRWRGLCPQPPSPAPAQPLGPRDAPGGTRPCPCAGPLPQPAPRCLSQVGRPESAGPDCQQRCGRAPLAQAQHTLMSPWGQAPGHAPVLHGGGGGRCGGTVPPGMACRVPKPHAQTLQQTRFLTALQAASLDAGWAGPSPLKSGKRLLPGLWPGSGFHWPSLASLAYRRVAPVSAWTLYGLPPLGLCLQGPMLNRATLLQADLISTNST